MPAKNDELDKLLHFLFQSWSIQSSSKWTEDNPAKKGNVG